MRDADPYGGFRFRVEILGLQVGGFTEVSGLEREVQVEDFREGGVNDYTHKLATVTKYPNLTLRRGIADAAELWQWHQDVVNGRIQRRQVNVVLIDICGQGHVAMGVREGVSGEVVRGAFNAATMRCSSRASSSPTTE